MEDNKAALPQLDTIDDIKEKIYTIRGVQVMLDSDLARIYGYWEFRLRGMRFPVQGESGYSG